MKRAVAIIAAALGVFAACASFNQTGAPSTTGSPEAGVTADASAEGGAITPSGPVIADGGFADGAPIDHVHGTGSCEGRGWTVCETYENSPDLPLETKTSGQIEVVSPGSASDHALQALLPDNSAAAYYYVSYPSSPSTFAWSFDLQVTDAIGDTSQFAQLGFTKVSGECAIQPSVHGAQLVIIQYCPDDSILDPVDVNLAVFDLAAVPRGEWINVALAFDAPSKRFDAAVVYPNGQLVVKTTKVNFALLDTQGGQFAPGVTYLSGKVSGSSTVILDNFAADWK